MDPFVIFGEEAYDNSVNNARSKDRLSEKVRLNEVKYMGTIQQSLLSIVDGLRELGEMLCNQAMEQQKAQEEFLKYQQRHFEYMEERSRQLALEERERKQQFMEEQEQQQHVYNRIDTVISDVVSESVAKGLKTIIPQEVETIITEQLGPILTEIKSTMSQQHCKDLQHKQHAFNNLKYGDHEGPPPEVMEPVNIMCQESTSHERCSHFKGRAVNSSFKTHSLPNSHSASAGSDGTQGYRKLQSSLIDNFEGSGNHWEGWKRNFIFVAEACNWTDKEILLMLRTHLKGDAMSAIQYLPDVVLLDWEAILDTLDARYGSSKASTKNRLRSELYTISQKDSEELEAFADRVFALVVNAYPDYFSQVDLQGYAVDAFLRGCKDQDTSFLCSIVPPKTIMDAVDQVKAIQVLCNRNQISHVVHSSPFPIRAAGLSPLSMPPSQAYV